MARTAVSMCAGVSVLLVAVIQRYPGKHTGLCVLCLEVRQSGKAECP